MTDYQPLIARAVDGLGKSTGEARRALYERARSALVAQLRAVEPALSEQEVTKERLSLEEAIRKVEAEAARKARIDVRNEPRFEPRPLRPPPRPAPVEPAPQVATAPPPPQREDPAAAQREEAAPAQREEAAPATSEPVEAAALEAEFDEPPHQPQDAEIPPPAPPPRPAPQSARSRILGARTAPLSKGGFKSFRNVVNEVDDLGSASARAARSARETRDTYEPPRPFPLDEDAMPSAAPHDGFEPELDADALRAGDYDALELRGLEPNYEYDDEAPLFPSQSGRPQPPRRSAEHEDYEQARPPRSYRGLVKLAVAGCVIGILVALLSWQWPHLTRLVAQLGSHQPTQVTQTPTQEPKFSGRVPQEQSAGQTPGQAPGAGTSSDQTPPAVAQRAVLYEADANDPQGMRYSGSVIWRTETVSPGPGLAPELVVRADIEIPDKKMTVTWSLRRNIDKALPASHTIEIMFNLPPDFAGGGISHVPGIVMKQAEQAGGTPLSGLAVKVTDRYFLIGLSAGDTEQQRNVQLLKTQEWFDIPVVYANGARAILAVEKGPPGDRAFADAFAAWGK
jgi:hypothetical protein